MKPGEYESCTLAFLIEWIIEAAKSRNDHDNLHWDIARRMTCHQLNMWKSSEGGPIIPEMLVRLPGEDDPEVIQEKKMKEAMEEYEKIDFSGADKMIQELFKKK